MIYNGKKGQIYQVIGVGLMLFAVIELGVIIWYNLHYDVSRIGTDTASCLELAKVMWEQKSVLVENYAYPTTLLIDTTVPLAAIFYGLVGNQYLANGLACSVTVVLLSIVFYSVLVEYRLSTYAKWLSMCVFLLPLSTGELGYFNFVLGGYALYAIKIITGLLVLKSILIYENQSITNNTKRWGLYILTGLLIFLTSFSSGVFIVTLVLLPLMITKMIKFLMNDQWKIILTEEYVVPLAYLVSAMLGLISSKIFVGFAARDASIKLVNTDQVFDNFFYVLQGYVEFFSALPEPGSDITVLSKVGFAAVFGLALFLCFVVTTIICIVRIVQAGKNGQIDSKYFFPVITLLYTVVLYTLINTSYGQPYFETRYLIFSVVFMLPLCGWVADATPEWIPKQIFNVVLTGGVCVTILAVSILGYQRVYQERFTDGNRLNNIITRMNELDADIVYFYGDDTQKDAQTILVEDTTNRMYDCLFENMSPIYWGNPIEHRVHYQEEISSVILTKSDNLFQQIPYGITRFYTYVGQVAEYQIYYSDGNYVQFATMLPEEDGETITIYPYSIGIQTTNGTFTDEGFVTDGTGGYATWGPYVTVPTGTYEFTLHYEVKECQSEVAGQFDVVVDENPMGVIDLQAGENTATLEVTFDETSAGGSLEYRSMINEGTVIALKSVEIKKIS